MPLRISIVEDDPAVRKSLACVIQGSPDFECLGAYGSAEEALSEVPHHLPDVLLMDIGLPGATASNAPPHSRPRILDCRC